MESEVFGSALLSFTNTAADCRWVNIVGGWTLMPSLTLLSLVENPSSERLCEI